MEFIAAEICTPSHLASRTPQAAYPATLAPDLIFALAVSTPFSSVGARLCFQITREPS